MVTRSTNTPSTPIPPLFKEEVSHSDGGVQNKGRVITPRGCSRKAIVIDSKEEPRSATIFSQQF